MHVLLGILKVPVDDRVCESFTQCNLNVTPAFRNTAALFEQRHEPVYERRNRSNNAWQRALQFDARAALVIVYAH